MYHYWVEQPGGEHKSENATLITSEQPQTVFRFSTAEGEDVLGEEELSEYVLRPQLNCLYQGEEDLNNALLQHYLFPPPEQPSLSKIRIKETDRGTVGASHFRVQADEFLDEFIFKGKVKEGFFVEAGADDFLLNTNSLYFEKLHGWTGLLVEPVFSQFQLGWVLFLEIKP